MKIALLLFLLIASPAFAALQQEDIDISLNADRTSEWRAELLFNETVKKSDFFVLAGVSSFSVLADGAAIECRATREVGTIITCEAAARNYTYNITTFPVVSSIQDFSVFRHRFSITQLTERFSVSIGLPLGTALAERSRLEPAGLEPFEPPFGRQGTDGRRIFVEWTLERPKLGETIDTAVVYESVQPVDYTVFAIIATGLVGAFVVFLAFFFRQERVEGILPVLTENERKVMEIVLREKQVDQRVIVKETDFSKAKVSRLLQDLEKRGLVEKKPKGRTNIITLKEKRRAQER